ncbi:winged helix-turn-helix transcriptional regulator [Salinicoccus cyprini]|uniref:Winged helix-turn-helix transcriptional regulator n=1 Tax=Salinicoccus cyprini TaxID=2493691 RepID=A0A558AT28_9STAP|nr:metalloregulator ArsR/SmtB family transcription factor [Salinicoccus cyprini]TVT27424.1 winged helix-turn-helix transcriptional regulator [Salinicoccus cyprini]
MSYQTLSQYLKVIADSSRLEILDLLSCGELCACDLLEHFEFSQPTLSHHMKLLRENDLILMRKDGNKNMYRLNKAVIENLTDKLSLLSSEAVPCICHDMDKGSC